jgi:hypothetical protein
LRLRSQLGGIDAILRTNGSFRIAYYGADTFDIAVQISRNLLQYFSADSEIVDGTLSTEEPTGNVIRVSLESSVPVGLRHDFPIKVEDSHFLLRNREGKFEEHYPDEENLAALFVRPVTHGSLELVVWGRTSLGLSLAARLTPLTTGIGQPDFVILEADSRWKGAEATSLGFFDAHWNISGSSVIASSGCQRA